MHAVWTHVNIEDEYRRLLSLIERRVKFHPRFSEADVRQMRHDLAVAFTRYVANGRKLADKEAFLRLTFEIEKKLAYFKLEID